MLNIEISPHPIHRVGLWVPVSKSRLERDAVEIYGGTGVFRGECPFEGLILTADLQGMVLKDPTTRAWNTDAYPKITLAEFYRMEQEGLVESVPVGLVLPEILAEIVRDMGMRPERVAVLLCGDLYGSVERGATGDVTSVWAAFEEVFPRVVGILGNHDLLPEFAPFEVLDGHEVSLGELRIGGVSGVIGNPRKPNRKSPEDYRQSLHRVLRHPPDLLLLHESPRIEGVNLPGRADLAEWLSQTSIGTLICSGHVPWDTLTADLPPHQVLNVDQRVVILRIRS